MHCQCTTQCKLLEHKWSMCTSGWKAKYQQKLQWVAPPPVQGVFVPVAEGRTPPAQVAASDHHHVCKWSICLRWLTEDNTTSTRCKGQGAKDKTESANARTSPTGGCTLKAHSSCPMLSLPCGPRPVPDVFRVLAVQHLKPST